MHDIDRPTVRDETLWREIERACEVERLAISNIASSLRNLKATADLMASWIDYLGDPDLMALAPSYPEIKSRIAACVDAGELGPVMSFLVQHHGALLTKRPRSIPRDLTPSVRH